jgi:hypothetical protein
MQIFNVTHLSLFSLSFIYVGINNRSSALRIVFLYELLPPVHSFCAGEIVKAKDHKWTKKHALDGWLTENTVPC